MEILTCQVQNVLLYQLCPLSPLTISLAVFTTPFVFIILCVGSLILSVCNLCICYHMLLFSDVPSFSESEFNFSVPDVFKYNLRINL